MVNPPSDPYGDLFIYYLKGCLISGSTIVNRSFVGNWEEDGYSFLFFKRSSLQVVEELTSQQPHLKLLDNFQMSYEEWQGGPVLPIQIGRIRVIPPWLETSIPMEYLPEESNRVEKKAIDILLDPGVVFGTGTHPTTRHCVEALQMLASRTSIGTVIDIGTGTGLLAIAAVKLGCKRALAIDLNHLAVKTASENIHLNRLEDKVLAVQGSADKFVDLPSDLVISNIHYDVMKRLFRRDRKLSAKYVILSGLLRSQATKVEALLKQVSITLLEKWETNGTWYSYLGKIPNGRQ
ncbi:50S ribosomal protein L11 methyltransferase [bacterium]|nr:50S ribosomal protein L11 methyltransferase [bacterium]